MTDTDYRRPLVDEPRTDVLDSGGEESRSHDRERLTAIALGVASAVLTYVALAQGPWTQSPPASVPPPAPVPAGRPAPSQLPGPTPHAARRCTCPHTADAVTAWLTQRHPARPTATSRALR
jgi:hypothetical protein